MVAHQLPDLLGHRALVPGGTGAVGEGVVRQLLAAGADVVVPTRSEDRQGEFLRTLGDAASAHLHLVVHDYTTFAGAEDLLATVQERLGGVDHVVAPIGGWWSGGPLRGIEASDWSSAFVDLATTHMAVLRAALPRLTERGSYALVVGDSATFPVPGSGLVSMEQSALLMMQRVAAAESERRVFSLVLGPVSSRANPGEPGWVTADGIGQVAAAIAGNAAFTGRSVPLHGPDEVASVVREIRATALEPVA